MKRANGLGSVFQEKGRRRNKWRAVITLGCDENGKQVRRTLGYYKTKVEGQRALAEYNADNSKFDVVPTFGELWNIVLKRKSDLSKSTQQSYSSAWNRLRVFEDIPINQIKALELQEVVDNMVEIELLGHGATKQVKDGASAVFDVAIENDYVTTNYAKFIIIPKRGKSDKRVFSDEEIDIILEDAKNEFWSKIIAINIFTAMRPSEVLEILEKDVYNSHLIGGMKTDAGRERCIPIHRDIKWIVDWFERNTVGDYLISINGKKITYDTYLNYFHLTTERLGLQRLTPHACRKTGATMYQRLGMPRIQLQRLLGHKDFGTTDRYYIGDLDDNLLETFQNL